ncbi:hypothetical protein [Microvirga subterranea]|uniref:hypothetical protein n=1 Tax=Microvirga subterranea TaxID=186651 RepID=UPI000E0B8F85|nr:hypothetical protein [Microvirga subterranea]
MKELTLFVDQRELSTVRAALLLLQEQIDVLPEDLFEMLRQEGSPLSEAELEELSQRLKAGRDPVISYAGDDPAVPASFSS